MKNKNKAIVFFTAIAIAGGIVSVFWFRGLGLSRDYFWQISQKQSAATLNILKPLPPLTPPKEIKALYLTADAAANPILVDYLIKLIKSTPLNSLVVNIKDNNQTRLDRPMALLARRLRKEGIYPIARIVVFQDNNLARRRPDLALKDADGRLFGKRGYYWLDPASKEIWDLNADTAIKALDLGFMEINFDYFRFPDGDVNNIVYPIYDYSRLKQDVISDAAAYIIKKIKDARPQAVVSLDIFADAFLRPVDIGIGQRLTKLAPHFDVLAPMVYPSHFKAGNFNFENPAAHPYEVVRQTLLSGKRQLKKAAISAKIRPWIQDFDMGAVYGREKIKAQIKAAKDSLESCSAAKAAPNGKTAPAAKTAAATSTPPIAVICQEGWMSWNPSNFYAHNKYTK